MIYFQALLIIFLGAGVALYEVPGLVRRQMRGELIAFSVFLLIGIVLALALNFGLAVPNPTSGIDFICGPVTRLLYPR
jgi:hypothetical protein